MCSSDLDGSVNPPQTRPVGPVINEQGPLLPAIDRAITGGSESEGPGSEQTNTAVTAEASTDNNALEDAQRQSTPQPEGLFSQTLEELFSDEPEGFVEDLTGRVEQNPVVIPSRRPREDDTDEGNSRSPKRSRMAEYTGNTSVIGALSSQSYNDQATALTNSDRKSVV